MTRRLRVLLLFSQSSENQTLSYQHGWPRHLQAHPRFDCIPVNLAALSALDRGLAAVSLPLRRPDAVVLLHSVFSNGPALSGHLLDAVRRLAVPKVLFLGNEYKLMPAKMAFAESLPTALLVTQSTDPRVHALYRERLGCAVAGIPNTGLDTSLFHPRTPRGERPVDVGYRALDGPAYLGHDERREVAERFAAAGARHGLRLDLSLRLEDRLADARWAAFLDRCKGQLGSEAGMDRFELTDATRDAVNAWLAQHPGATRADVHARFFEAPPGPGDVPMRIISGRNIEAAGTKTVQLLLEGSYGGYLQPGVHYIALRKDWSNLDGAIAAFRDDALCERLTAAAYELAQSRLTYEKLIDGLAEAMGPVVA